MDGSGACGSEQRQLKCTLPEARADPAPIHAKPRVVDSAGCGKGGGKVILFSDRNGRRLRPVIRE